MAESGSMITLWSLPDDLWQRIEWLLNKFDPPKHRGRKRSPALPILDGLIYNFRTGCRGIRSPKSMAMTQPSIAPSNVGCGSEYGSEVTRLP